MRRALDLAVATGRQLYRAPVTLGYLVAVWIAGLATGSIMHGPSKWLLAHVGVGVPSLSHAYWWTPLSAGLWSSSLGSYLVETVLALCILAPAERRMGVLRAFGVLLVSQVAGTLLATGLIKLAGIGQEPWLSQLTGETDVGLLTGVTGVGFALSCTLSVLWRRRLRLLLTVAIVITALYVGHIQEVSRACAGLIGLGLGVLLYGRTRPWKGLRASHHEVRVLVAILVATSAIGGMITALIANPVGPLAPFSFLFAYPAPDPHDVASACAHGLLTLDCRDLHEQQLYTQWPGILVQLGPALLMLLSADGLRRGRRAAWWIALVLNLLVLLANVWGWYLGYTDPSGGLNTLTARVQYIVFAAEAGALPVVTILVLLATRRRFDQAAGRRATRRLTAMTGAAVLATCAVYLGLGYLLRDHFRPEPRFSTLATDLPERLLTGKAFDNHFMPADLVGRLLYVWLFLAFWIVILGALTVFFIGAGSYREAGAPERARRLLLLGGSTLSYMTTWPGNRYWFSADGRAAMAYRAIGGVAITVGGPYGEREAREPAISEFARFCEHRGWQPCLYSVTEAARKVTDSLDWRSVQVAEETLVPLSGLEFRGRKWQDVRTSLNKAAKAGITAEWWRYGKAPLDIVEQIQAISEEWVADKGLPEMGFTLGGLDELDDPNIRCLIAVGTDRKVHGVTSWMPVYRDGLPVSWTLDFMRRNTSPDAFRGVMEFLIASAAMTFKAEGIREVSLSGAPLARMDRGDDPGALQRLLDGIADTMEPVYGFRSLLNFKAKFQPSYRPLYMAYPDPAALPSIAAAIGHAYLPHLTSRQAIRLIRKLRAD